MLERLIALAAPPATRSDYDWPATRARLGFDPPADYVALCGAYGPGTFAQSIDLLVPDAANPHFDLFANVAVLSEVLAAWGEETHNAVPHRLVPWGDLMDIGFIAWELRTDDAQPQAVLLDTEELAIRWLAPTVTEAVLGLLTGTVAREYGHRRESMEFVSDADN